MLLSNQDIADLVSWRRKLHEQPEISGEEAETARQVVEFLADTGPDLVLEKLGGYGVAVAYQGAEPGPTVMIRSELDALPIEELSDVPHRSQVQGKGHLCGHDGHTAILAALGRVFGRERPQRGRVVLMFQPAEENGAGAAAVIADPRFADIQPDFAFSLHNIPGIPFGEARIKDGIVNCASRGMRIVLTGKTAHASAPETGLSPMKALAFLMPGLTSLSTPDFESPDFAMVTVTHATMGAAAFGIAPGHAEIWATLRTLGDERMADLVAVAERLTTEAATAQGLDVMIEYHDIFQACDNHPEAVAELRRALDEENIRHDETTLPMRASEDFGRFGAKARSAMFFLGSGEDYPSLHNPDYDFPDDLIPIGAKVFVRAARNLLG